MRRIWPALVVIGASLMIGCGSSDSAAESAPAPTGESAAPGKASGTAPLKADSAPAPAQG